MPPDRSDTITVQIPASAIVAVAPRPATVSQRTCEQHFGLCPRLYLRMAKSGLFPSKVVGRLRIARYEDIEAALTGKEDKPPKASAARALLDSRTMRAK